VPLAGPGLDLRAQWLWRSSPASPVRVAARNGAAAVTCGGIVAAAGFGIALALEPAAPATVAPLAVAGLVVLGTALLAGALVPWRSERPIEQLGAYAAFAVVVTAVWVALARVAPYVGAERGPGAAWLAGAAFAACAAASVLYSAGRT